jgi:hypothetical protein
VQRAPLTSVELRTIKASTSVNTLSVGLANNHLVHAARVGEINVAHFETVLGWLRGHTSCRLVPVLKGLYKRLIKVLALAETFFFKV